MKKFLIIWWIAYNPAGQYLGKFTSLETCNEYVKSFNGTCQIERGN